jgi:hypothetical protein
MRREPSDGTSEQRLAGKRQQRLVGPAHAARSAAGKNDARDALMRVHLALLSC